MGFLFKKAGLRPNSLKFSRTLMKKFCIYNLLFAFFGGML